MGSKQIIITTFCHQQVCMPDMPPAKCLLAMATKPYTPADAMPHKSPWVAVLASENDGVRHTSPMLTITIHCNSRTLGRSLYAMASKIAVNTGKQANPSVPTATPPSFMPIKKVTKCSVSNTPLMPRPAISRSLTFFHGALR